MQKRISIILVLLACLCLPAFVFAETVVLKSGKTVEGKLIEKTDKYIKIDFQGVPLTYYFDEIDSINGQKVTFFDNTNVLDAKEGTLFEAIKKGDIQKVQQLINEGVDVNAKNDAGAIPLVWAVTGCHKEIVELLLANGAKVNIVDSSMGMTPLMWAAHRCNKNIVELLLAKDADIEMKDVNGKSAWIWSAVNRNKDAKDVVELFLSKGADVNAKDNSGGTVLMWAAGMGNKDIVELLFAKGADINAKNNHGATAVMYAEKYAEKTGQKDVVEFLRSKEGLAQSANIPTKPGFVEASKIVVNSSTRNSLNYDNDLLNLGIRFNPPNGWIKKISHAGLGGIQYVQPQNKASIVISVPKSLNYLTFLALLVTIRIQSKPSSEEKIDLLGGPCYVFIYEMANSGGTTFKIKNYNLFKNGKIFTMNYMALPFEFDNYLIDFKASLDAFEIE